MRKPAKPTTMKAAAKKWEGSAADQKMDKKLGVKENSPKDRAMDKKMTGGKCVCGKTLKNGRCPGCSSAPSRCQCVKKHVGA